jgi:hypothetical protein
MDIERSPAENAAIVAGLSVVAPLIEASMADSQRTTEQLMASNLKSGFIDGFEAGIIEGQLREKAKIRKTLGIHEEAEPCYTAEDALGYLISKGKYPYSLLGKSKDLSS